MDWRFIEKHYKGSQMYLWNFAHQSKLLVWKVLFKRNVIQKVFFSRKLESLTVKNMESLKKKQNPVISS